MKSNEPFAWLGCVALLCSVAHLTADELAVVKEGRVNVRGQPSLVGEVITQLQQGEKVIVLEQVPAAKGKTNEPAAWARIQMPANTPVWVYAPFIDPASKAVKVPRLNLRGGPGENFSVVGRLERGATVTEIRRVSDWMEIETPPGAYGFVAANLLEKPAAGTGPAVAKSEPVAPAPTATQPPPPKPAATNTAAVVPPGPVASTSTPPPVKNPLAQPKPEPVPPPKSQPPLAVQPAPLPAVKPQTDLGPIRRVVRREGLVRSTASIQAPTYYELLNPDNRKTINYLHTDKIGVDLKNYRGRQIIVTGEEGIDPRWPKTPVINVETLQLIP